MWDYITLLEQDMRSAAAEALLLTSCTLEYVAKVHEMLGIGRAIKLLVNTYCDAETPILAKLLEQIAEVEQAGELCIQEYNTHGANHSL